MLRKAGLKHRDDPTHDAFRLDEIVVGINGNQNIEVRDPATNIKEKKPAKPFMVNQTNILLERDRLIISEHDKVLWRQMENYQVVKISVDGRPTYTSVNEHALDGLMLAILGMTIQFPQIAKIIHKFEPNRHMAKAPPIPFPEPSFDREKPNDESEKEFFLTSKMRANNSKTWERVDDLKKARDARKGGSFTKRTVLPRGRSSKKVYSRPKF